MLPEEPSSLHNVCPRCFNQNDWPIFSSAGWDFYTAYFFEHPWYDGWHEVVGGALGTRVRRHPSHDLWREEARAWSQGHVQRWNIPEVTGFMRQLHREPCNYIRFQRYVMDGTMYLTQWGDAALALIVTNSIPKFEAAGYKKSAPALAHRIEQRHTQLYHGIPEYRLWLWQQCAPHGQRS